MTEPFTITLREGSSRGLASLNAATMRRLGLTAGDTIQLSGSKVTHARAVPGHVDETCIALDSTAVANSGLEVGQTIALSKVSLAPLSDVVIKLNKTANKTPTDLQDTFFDMALTEGDVFAIPGQNAISATVERAAPSNAGLIGEKTVVTVTSPPGAPAEYAPIAGMRKQVAKVHELIAAPLLRRDLFDRLGVSAPRGILFSGPPGSGKTLLARSVADATKASFFQIDGPEILSKHYGESEAALRRVFEAAAKAEPAIIFIDELDSIAPRREGLSGEKQVERRVVAQLLTSMDGMADRGRVVVMAATNLPDSIDPALRRPGRFDREVAFPPPTDEERQEILALHLADAPLASDADLGKIARSALGYVGADLAALAREAAMAALTRTIHEAGGEDNVDAHSLQIAQEDLETGLRETEPSLLRGNRSDAAPLSWDEIGGLDEVKSTLRRIVTTPVANGTAMKSLGLTPPGGILLTGPPGSGKTLLARALATEAKMNFVPVRAPQLVSQFLGEAEKSVTSLFASARQAAPSLLFFDEFDALAPRRGGQDGVFDRIVAQLLVEMDGISQFGGVTVLAATNRAAAIDPALLRTGRFDRVIEVPLPDSATRAAILDVHLRPRQHDSSIDASILVEKTNGLSGSDIAGVVDQAAWNALLRAESGAEPRILLNDLLTSLDHHLTERQAVSKDFIRQTEAAE